MSWKHKSIILWFDNRCKGLIFHLGIREGIDLTEKHQNMVSGRKIFSCCWSRNIIIKLERVTGQLTELQIIDEIKKNHHPDEHLTCLVTVKKGKKPIPCLVLGKQCALWPPAPLPCYDQSLWGCSAWFCRLLAETSGTWCTTLYRGTKEEQTSM